MSDKMFYQKRAQAADTITWVVATTIIVIVLTISIFATNFASNEKTVFLLDKQKDLLATKSITAFLSNQKNVDLLNNNNKNKVGAFLEVLPKPNTFFFLLPFSKDPLFEVKGSGGWNFELYNGGSKKIELYHYTARPILASNFETILLYGKIKLRFWVQCSLDKCR